MKFLVLGCAALMMWVGVGAGCASMNRRGGVAVTLVSVAPQQSSLFETTVLLTLRLTNEGVEALPLMGSAHRIHFNGTYVGRAVSDEKVMLPRLGSTTQTVVAHFENLTLMRKAQELGNVPRVEYRIDSQLHVAERGGTIGATATGQLDLSGLLPQSAANPPR
jgi:LEA14-like dessication related protein